MIHAKFGLNFYFVHKSFKIIGLLVLAKMIFEGFLPYMGMAAILVMRPGLFI